RDGEEGVRSIGVIITTEGNTVRSTASGIVEKVGRMRGFGNFIVVRHAGGLVSVYSGLDSIRVREGDPVARGCELGSFDKARSDLHFMFHRSGKPEDPLKILPSEKG
ncbi:MAG TPA: M23 family metallopeptidase, partial [Spirochaetota bacterium]